MHSSEMLRSVWW